MASEAPELIDGPVEDIRHLEHRENDIGTMARLCPSTLSCVLGTICFPITLISCISVEEMNETILLNWGKYSGRLTKPGLYIYNPFGTTSRTAVTSQTVIDLQTTKIADANGNPVEVSAIVTFHVVDSKKALLAVSAYREFVEKQALTAMKTVCSKYPYEDGDEGQSEVSLKGETTTVRAEMKKALQEKVYAAGIFVDSFELTDLSYAREIAQAMLVRQQAQATVKARETIVKGAVDIAYHAVQEIESRGVVMTDSEKSKLMSGLLITICGESHVQPTLNVGP